jgi:hypothetical protein
MIRWIIGALAALTLMAGCQKSLIDETTDKLPDGTVVRTITQTIFKQDYAVLNALAGLCSVMAVVIIVGRAFGAPFPIKSAWTCAFCAAGCWLARMLLAEYLWLFVVLVVIALIAGAMSFAYGHRSWLERKLNLDLNRSGKIGD